ncbi:uncharacterized protein LOC126833050 isoform X2 [Adelges cooleyi]|uniref:uncharacterized protein LOC126833050 isoform X2 n=1 Tax=Adelges cooleyi TaxID=133065 RepID=UPI00217F7557|nr:uncharacterized protein LOC126833050 isoform X2 [Adelges cooleyi]
MEIERTEDKENLELFDLDCKTPKPCQTKIPKIRAPRFKKTDLEEQLDYIEKCVLQPHIPKSYTWLSTITMPAVLKHTLTDSYQQYQRATVELTTIKSHSQLGKLGKKSLNQSSQNVDRGKVQCLLR